MKPQFPGMVKRNPIGDTIPELSNFHCTDHNGHEDMGCENSCKTANLIDTLLVIGSMEKNSAFRLLYNLEVCTISVFICAAVFLF